MAKKSQPPDWSKLQDKRNLTYQEFRLFTDQIRHEIFGGDLGTPIQYAIARTHFEEKQIMRMLGLARRVPLQTAKSKMAIWDRQLRRCLETRKRLESRLQEAPPQLPKLHSP